MCAYQPPTWTASPWFLVTPPELQSTDFERPRMLAALDSATKVHQVTLLTAPAGSGKTTALSQWARTRPGAVAWLSLTRFDDDPQRLINGVASSLQRLAVDRPEYSRFLELDSATSNLAESQRALLEVFENVEGELVILIDDAHLAPEHLEEAVVSMFTGRAPPNVRAVIAGRPSVSLALARSLLHGSIQNLETDLLAFTIEEIEVAGDLLERRIDRATAERVHRSTNGWAVAVRISLLTSIDGPGPVSPDVHDLLTDYVVEEILDDLRPEMVDFILSATTCSLLDHQIATALSERSDAASLLQECAARGLFLDRFSRGEADPVYLWHGLFAEQCRALLRRRDPDRSHRLNRVAAELLADRDPMQAVVHALRAEDPPLALQIIEDNWLALIITSDSRLLHKACMSLPVPWVDDPKILLIRACCQDLDKDRLGGSLLYDRATALLEETETDRSSDLAFIHDLTTLIVADERDLITGAVERIEAVLRGNHQLKPSMAACTLFVLGWAMARTRYHPERTSRVLRAALEQCKATGQSGVAQRAAANLAFALVFNGEFQEAKRSLETLNDPDSRKGAFLAIDGSISYTAAGLLAYWQDDLDTAWDSFIAGAKLGGDEASFATISLVFLAWVAAASGDRTKLSQAQVSLTRVPRSEARGAPWQSYRSVAHALVAEAHGHHDVAIAMVRQLEDYPAITLFATVAADLLRRCGEPERALEIIGELSALPLPRNLVACHQLTEALIHADNGRDREARILLERSLDYAAQEEMRRPYLTAGDKARNLLSDHAAWGTRHELFIVDLLNRWGTAQEEIAPEALSRREREVLGYLQTTMSNAEIADALHVSLNTLKTHQRAIYRKLGVNNRRDAIRYYYSEVATAGVTLEG